jgi:uncharacterized protein YjbJ (UPF0337 family)
MVAVPSCGGGRRRAVGSAGTRPDLSVPTPAGRHPGWLRDACAAVTAAERGAVYNHFSLHAAGLEETTMNDDRIEGTKHQIKGTVKEGVGKLTGDTPKEVAGNLEKNAGKVQNQVGKAEDEIHDVDD